MEDSAVGGAGRVSAVAGLRNREQAAVAVGGVGTAGCGGVAVRAVAAAAGVYRRLSQKLCSGQLLLCARGVPRPQRICGPEHGEVGGSLRRTLKGGGRSSSHCCVLLRGVALRYGTIARAD